MAETELLPAVTLEGHEVQIVETALDEYIQSLETEDTPQTYINIVYGVLGKLSKK